jgi:hypothetical protein
MFKKGQKVVRVIYGAGTKTASIVTIGKVSRKKGIVWLDDQDDLSDESPSAYYLDDGLAVRNWITGFSSCLIILEE